MSSRNEPLFLAQKKELEVEEVKGLRAFHEYGQYMCEKYPEYREQNSICVLETTKLLEYLAKQNNLPVST